MSETNTGTFRRKSKARFIEIEARRSDTYESFAKKAAVALRISLIPRSKLTLFKVNNGAAIANDHLSIQGKARLWTLGNYLQVVKKSPNNVKIGCGCVFEDDESSNEIEVYVMLTVFMYSLSSVVFIYYN